MSGALEILNRSFKSFLDQGDPRVKDWPLMRTPFPGIAMIAAYIYFVKVAGPQFMKKRKPYDLRNIMVVYNFALVLLNLYLFLALGWYSYFNGYTLKCQPVDYSNNHDAVRLAQIGYQFYLTKFLEFADTIFFVLRKKDNQISALHVIHHSIVPFSLWFGIKFAPGGYNALFPFLNSFVHVIMYAYYGLAAFGDRYKKYLFWKKYMTYMQLAQFVAVIVYAISLWYNQCDISKTFIMMNLVHAALFFGLFLNFFMKNYTRKSPYKKYSIPVGQKDETKPSLGKQTVLSENGNTHVNKLVSQMKKEVDSHMAQLHSCATEACCHLRCRIAQNGVKHKKHYNNCTSEKLNTFNNSTVVSEFENANCQKVLKDL